MTEPEDRTPSSTNGRTPASGSGSRWGGLRVLHFREIMLLATPTILAMLSQTLMWTVDTALLGRVSNAALAAAGLGGVLTWTAYSLFNNLSRITGTFVSQAHGRGDAAAVGRYTWQGIYIALATGLLLQVMGYYSYLVLPWTHNPTEIQDLSYVYIKWRSLSAVCTQVTFALMGFFQGRRDVKVPMYAGIIANLVNLVLDVWLIFGWSGFELGGHTWLAVAPLGVKGAAIGTSASTLVNMVVLGVWALGPGLRARYRLHRLRRPELRAIANLVRVGLPASWEGFSNMLGFTMFTIFVGTTGAVALAASQITVHVLSFSFMPMWGLTTAAGVLTGNWLGAKRPDQAERYGRQAFKLGIYYSLGLGVLLILLRDSVFRIFTDDPEVLALGAGLTVIAAVFQLFDGIRMLGSGILQGAGDTRYPMIVMAVIMFGLFIPVTWAVIVPLEGDVVTAWIAASGVYLVNGVLLWRRFESGKWKRVEIFR